MLPLRTLLVWKACFCQRSSLVAVALDHHHFSHIRVVVVTPYCEQAWGQLLGMSPTVVVTPFFLIFTATILFGQKVITVLISVLTSVRFLGLWESGDWEKKGGGYLAVIVTRYVVVFFGLSGGGYDGVPPFIPLPPPPPLFRLCPACAGFSRGLSWC